ncbi:MAG: hypothetical protein IPK82_19790 [Polyangiaceae bacterium]|nr:hypothetical protein [Polyangiaceae bacterium]
MKKFALLSMLVLAGSVTAGCTAEAPECDDTEEVANADGAEASPCDDDEATTKRAAGLSHEEQEY